MSALRVAVKLKPSDAPAHGALGVALQESGQLDEAESQLEAALAIDSQSAYLLDHLAQAYAAQRRFAAAIEKWTAAARLVSVRSGHPRLSWLSRTRKTRIRNAAIDILKNLVQANPEFGERSLQPRHNLRRR